MARILIFCGFVPGRQDLPSDRCKSIRVKVLINIRVYVSIISSKVSSGSE